MSPPMPSRLRDEENDDSQKDQTPDNGKCNLYPAIRPIALYLARAGIDEDAERLVAIAIHSQPHRQQNMLIRHAHVLRLHAAELLMIAANILRTKLANAGIHNLLGAVKTFRQRDDIPL